MKNFSDYGIDVTGKTGDEVKVTCPQCSAKRKKRNFPCLNVSLDKGVWNCWHCGWRGSLGKGELARPAPPKTYQKPTYITNRTELPEGVVKFFANRGISQATLIRNQIGHGAVYFPQVEEERTCVTFPYFRGGECINVKYRTHDKLFRLASGAERILYGLDDVGETLIWVEGEIDKLSMEEAGFMSVVSVPDGAPAPETKDYTNKFDFLDCEQIAGVKEHIIAVDNDAPGRRLQEELTRRLGMDKCRIVTWPEGCKDANDALIAHGTRTIQECVESAELLPIEGTCEVMSLLGDVMRHYDGEIEKGYSTGWPEIDRHYTVLPGEWTLVTGIPGHGKSEWLDALTINLAANHGWTFAVFSPENHPPSYHTIKLLEKHSGQPFYDGPTPRIPRDQVRGLVEIIDAHFTYMMPDTPSLDTLLEQAGRLVARKGIKGLIIDPWNEIEHQYANRETETLYISAALTKIRRFCWRHGVHTWVVAHPSKLYKDKQTGEYPVPNPYDVSGSAHWRNKADNCITVHRDVLDNLSPVQIHIQKIRKKTVGKIGAVDLRYDRVTGRYAPWAGTSHPVYSLHKESA